MVVAAAQTERRHPTLAVAAVADVERPVASFVVEDTAALLVESARRLLSPHNWAAQMALEQSGSQRTNHTELRATCCRISLLQCDSAESSTLTDAGWCC